MRRLSIAIGQSCRTLVWQNIQVSWEQLVQKMRVPVVTSEKYSEYMNMPLTAQSKIKDVGGFVGGFLHNGKRGKRNVMYRSLVTLDLDFADFKIWDRLVWLFPNVSMILHGTHKCSLQTPRFRLILPLTRDVTPEEYVAISRKVAEWVGITVFDKTTFQCERLMYYPSVSSDMPYYYMEQNGFFLDADRILCSYKDWRDVSTYCFHPDEEPHNVFDQASAQVDPLEKKGIVGTFCRAYTIREAIAKFLPDIYREEEDGRFTYTQASGYGGLVIYDDKFAYSHHSTDPANNGHVNNAFDLVRIHLFGSMDKDWDPDSKKVPPSYKVMHDMALTDGEVKKEILRSRGTMFEFEPMQPQAATEIFKGFVGPVPASIMFKYFGRAKTPKATEIFKGFQGLITASFLFRDFGKSQNNMTFSSSATDLFINTPTLPNDKKFNPDPQPEPVNQPDLIPMDPDWITKLEYEKKGDKPAPTAYNLGLIMRYDPVFRGHFVLDKVSLKKHTVGKLPWVNYGNDDADKLRSFTDTDRSGVREHIEKKYGISSREKVDDQLNLLFERNMVHPLHNYLLSRKWDGIKRIDTFLSDTMGVEDNEYTREVSRLFLGGAVCRALYPGCKFDNVLTLVGKEGVGKSTLFAKLGKEWFSDSFPQLNDHNKACEAVSRAWIMEIAELASFKKSDSESVKAFTSRTHDEYRPAYGREPICRARHTAFVATTNETRFLKGPMNRRFWPVRVNIDKAKIDVFDDSFDAYVSQIWAEAVEMVKQGGIIKNNIVRDLNSEARKIAAIERDLHTIKDDRLGLVESYLNKPIPADFETWGFEERKQFYDGGLRVENTVQRNYVTAMEVWCEVLSKQVMDADRLRLSEIRDILSSVKGWEPVPEKVNYTAYGPQQILKRI